MKAHRRKGFVSRPIVADGCPYAGVVCWRQGARGRANIFEFAQSVRLIFGLRPGDRDLPHADKALGCAVLDRGEPVGLLFADLADAEAFRAALGYRRVPPHRWKRSA